MKIRPDYAEVEHLLAQFVTFSQAFRRFNVSDWSDLKNRHDFELVYSLNRADQSALASIYADGRDLAVHMGDKLVAFNWPEEYPTLKSYVDSFNKGWITQRDILRTQSSTAKAKATQLGNLCPQVMSWMIELFDKQIEMLDAVAATLDLLRLSNVYQGIAASSVQSPYQLALNAIHRTGKMFERVPSTYSSKGEEDLRDHLLVSLASLKGASTGESFNKAGKTDILYQVNGSNELIAECKFWGGEKGFLATLDQLLRYLTSRDRQVAVILFVRNKDFTSVTNDIPQYAAKHPNYVRHLNDVDATWQNYEFNLPVDAGCKIQVAIQLYHTS
jgi:hypothetical protein